MQNVIIVAALWSDQGQRQSEGGTGVYGTLHADATSEYAADDVVRDIQSQAGATFAQFCSEKRIENPGQIAGWNPDAVILHGDFYPTIRAIARIYHNSALSPSFKSVQQCVVDQISQHLA